MTTELTAEERRVRTAVHEASHAVMAYELGVTLGTVSIRPGNHHRGIMFHGTTNRTRPWNEIQWVPTPLQHAGLRRTVELSIMISLSGAIGVRYFSPLVSGYFGMDPHENDALDLAKRLTLAPLGQDEARRLKAAEEQDEPLQTDETNAEELARAMAGDATAAMYVAWLRTEVEQVMQKERFGRLVLGLVPVLLDREVVSGRAVRELFRSLTGRGNQPRSLQAAASTD